MAKARRSWQIVTRKPRPPTVPAALKREVEDQAHKLIDTVLAPRIPPMPENPQFNQLVAIGCRWYQSWFYFTSTYRVFGENAIVPSFEAKFARLTYTGNERFTLGFMRYTGQWVDVYENCTLSECLTYIAEDEFFAP